jgi:hypothetical protein
MSGANGGSASEAWYALLHAPAGFEHRFDPTAAERAGAERPGLRPEPVTVPRHHAESE